MTRTDVQLMLDVKAGDDASFDFLLRKYRTPLVNFLYRIVRDAATADGSGAGSVPASLPRARAIYSEREVHHLVVPDRNEPGAQFRSR